MMGFEFQYMIPFLIAYLLGCIPFGLILTKIFLKKDIREIGSGNIGATNVLRSGHKFIAFMTLVLDGLKGALGVWIIMDIPVALSSSPGEIRAMFIIGGLFAILGHCFPVWLKFKGGKGVATAFGVLIAAVPIAALVSAATWGIVAGFFRYSSLAALSAAAIAPLATLLIYGVTPAIITLLITILIFWRHKDNIKRLTAGEESKIGAKKTQGGDDAQSSSE